MVDHEVDMLIVGGGVVGATLLLALAPLGLRLLLVDANPLSNQTTPVFDIRSIALSPASVRILKHLKVWPHVEARATPIQGIHVSEKGRWGQTRLYAEKDDPLGVVVEMQALTSALSQMLELQTVIAPAKLTAYDINHRIATIERNQKVEKIKAKWVVAADGVDSSMRSWCGLEAQIKHYEQYALVATIALARSHEQWAYERFTTQGPLACLPLQDNKVALIWSLPPNDAEYFSRCTSSEFLSSLQQTFGYRLGRFMKVGQRLIFPLREINMPIQVIDGVVFVGNAAHTLHPVAGQGLNLGLRDVAMLAECISKTGLSKESFLHYQSLRQGDQRAISSLTDGLIQLFSKTHPSIKSMRSLGLFMFDNIPLLKNILKRYAGGFAGILPALVCEDISNV